MAAHGQLWSKGGDRGVYKSNDGGESWERIHYVSEHNGAAERLSPYWLNEMIFRNGVEVPRRLAGNSPCGMPDVVTSSLFLAVPLREDFHKVELQNHL